MHNLKKERQLQCLHIQWQIIMICYIFWRSHLAYSSEIFVHSNALSLFETGIVLEILASFIYFSSFMRMLSLCVCACGCVGVCWTWWNRLWVSIHQGDGNKTERWGKGMMKDGKCGGLAPWCTWVSAAVGRSSFLSLSSLTSSHFLFIFWVRVSVVHCCVTNGAPV